MILWMLMDQNRLLELGRDGKMEATHPMFDWISTSDRIPDRTTLRDYVDKSHIILGLM